MKQVEPKQILVWRNGKQEVKTLPFSYGGRVGRTTKNNKEAFEMYERMKKDETKL